MTRFTSRKFDQAYYEEHKACGLDYLSYSDWQRRYGRWIVESFDLVGKKLLDVGCACGAILRGMGEAGAVVAGVELNEHMVRLSREQWPDMAPWIHVCDAVHLHLFEDCTFDAVHSACVAEHWKPHLVPHILAELFRVLKPGGVLVTVLDTLESIGGTFPRENEDPTHVSMHPQAWWDELVERVGYEHRADLRERLLAHPEQMFSDYGWGLLIASRPNLTLQPFTRLDSPTPTLPGPHFLHRK